MRRNKDTTYGQKGGEGPTRGRKAVVYEGAFPDGTSFTKRTFFPPEGDAVAWCYAHKGTWHCAGINPAEREAPKDYTLIEVTPAR